MSKRGYTTVRSLNVVVLRAAVFTAFSGMVCTRIAFATPSESSPHTVSSSAQYLGAATCASSNCHGASAPRTPSDKGSQILHNEFVTWFRHDKHAGSYAVLRNEQSKQIARNLSIASPEKDSLCLSCHATKPGSAQNTGPKFRVEDGVSCESCHGASSGWIKGHTETGATHAKNVANGMHDIVDVRARTGLCLSCHLGGEDKDVNHKLIGAGHPRLTFEIDTFSAVEPRHWDLSEQYQQRKGRYDSAKAWLTGLILQSEARLTKLASPKRSHAGVFPEFTTMNCSSCHHSLEEHQFSRRDYAGKAGEPSLNVSELLVLSSALTVIDSAQAASLSVKTKELTEGFGRKEMSPVIASLQKSLAGPVAATVSQTNFTPELYSALFSQLTAFSQSDLQYETAEQIAMGASAVAAANPSTDKTETLKLLYQALRDSNHFDPRAFEQVQ